MMRRFVLLSFLVGTLALSACAPPTAATSQTATATADRPTAAQIPITSTPPTPPEPYVIVDIAMYVRNGPGVEFDVIAEIESQKQYPVIGRHVDWWLVDLGNDRSGWVYAPVNETRFFGNADAVPELPAPSTPTPEVIAACTPADQTETPSEGLENARNALTSFFELLSQREYESAAALYGGEYRGLREWNPLVDPQDDATLLKNGCEINGLQCLPLNRIVAEGMESMAEYHFTVEFMNQDGTLFERGPCCGASETEQPPESQFAYTVIRNCAGKFLVVELPVYVP